MNSFLEETDKRYLPCKSTFNPLSSLATCLGILLKPVDIAEYFFPMENYLWGFIPQLDLLKEKPYPLKVGHIHGKTFFAQSEIRADNYIVYRETPKVFG